MGIKVSEKNYFLEETNKTPLVAVRSAGLDIALPCALAPALAVSCVTSGAPWEAS